MGYPLGKKRLDMTKEKHYNWKGNLVTKIPLHQYVRRHLPMPSKCQICFTETPMDLANVTGIYNREFENWRYLCRKCHMALDMGKVKIVYLLNQH